MRAKLLTIAWKDIYTTFKDRNAMLYLFATPVALSLIIGLAFGTGGDVEIDAVPVGVVNRDAGATLPDGSTLNLGQTFQDAFVPTGDADTDAAYAMIHDLTDGEVYDDPDRARALVEDGDLAALITIGAEDFSANALVGTEPGTVAIYYDSGRSVGPSVVRSITNAIANGMNAVILAQRVGAATLVELGGARGQDEAHIGQAVAQLSRESMAVAEAAPVQVEQVNLQGETRAFDALQYFAPSMAILFMTFMMGAGGTSLLEESRRWTLQRIITTPTPRWLFLGGKLVGTYATGVVQMVILMVATTLVALMMGREGSVWGTNVVGLALMTLAVVFAATSLGLMIAAAAKTPEQAANYSTIVMLLLGMLGGSFIPIEGLPAALAWLPKITLNYWGIQGFFALAYESAPVGDIVTYLLALIAIGLVLFAVSLGRFSQRLDI